VRCRRPKRDWVSFVGAYVAHVSRVISESSRRGITTGEETRVVVFVRMWALNVALAALWLWFAKAHSCPGRARVIHRASARSRSRLWSSCSFSHDGRPIETSYEPVAWAATVIGAFGPMLMRPEAGSGSAAAFVAMLGQVVRIECEEGILTRDPAYGAYRRRVQIRLVPFVY
jgi:protein-S-isoprenylcysteine O-methyltransferase Ste14